MPVCLRHQGTSSCFSSGSPPPFCLGKGMAAPLRCRWLQVGAFPASCDHPFLCFLHLSALPYHCIPCHTQMGRCGQPFPARRELSELQVQQLCASSQVTEVQHPQCQCQLLCKAPAQLLWQNVPRRLSCAASFCLVFGCGSNFFYNIAGVVKCIWNADVLPVCHWCNFAGALAASL